MHAVRPLQRTGGKGRTAKGTATAHSKSVKQALLFNQCFVSW